MISGFFENLSYRVEKPEVSVVPCPNYPVDRRQIPIPKEAPKTTITEAESKEQPKAQKPKRKRVTKKAQEVSKEPLSNEVDESSTRNYQI